MNIESVDFGGIPIENIYVGMAASYTHTVSDADIKAYAGISGDNNPVHMSQPYAEKTKFGKRIAHGLYSVGFFSALFGTKLPGAGCVYVSQNLKFKRPVYIDDTIIARIEVTSVNLTKRRVFFNTQCYVSGKLVIDGDAEIYIS